ncbi:D-alanyl-D-alanine carboxypeptidase [Mycolicibacterium fortuitum]|jgi:D-alanyl-D-alanine carboxypeptidase/D-alanyl-D-alanine carboxypeptidase (penicillin-binding protein 5/6)|nr:D-alanyl-D-alanine carboxypeptidase [Mycolicibacterium fortuitum]
MNKFFKVILLILTLVFSLQTQTFAVEDQDHFSLNSEAAILIDATTGSILFEKESDRLMYPASITKIVTGIIAIEEGNLDDIVTVSKAARNIDGTRVYLLEGEQVSLKKLVQGLLINSGNDAATAIAEYFDKNEAQFAERMNEYVRAKIGVKDTTFQNPHGLFDQKHQTTAYDMAMITQYAMKNPLFRSIVGTKEMKWVGEGWETTLYNHNKLLWRYEGTTGVKNGFIDQSGYTLVASVKRGNSEWIAVTLKSGSSELAYSDMEKLFDYGFEHFETYPIAVNTLSLHQRYQDQFVLPKELVFTAEKDLTFKVEIDESEGQIIVVDNNGESIYFEELERIEQNVQTIIISDPSLPAESEPSRTSTLKIILLIVATLFTLVFIRTQWIKIKRRNMRKVDKPNGN